MSPTPTISIIMPCYNAGEQLRQSVTSVARQTFSDFELILVDDGSNDDTPNIIRDLATEHAFLKSVHQKNRGAAAARNRGLLQARGRYIAFLDADDTWTPDFLKTMFTALEARPDAVLAYCGWQNLGLEDRRCQPFVPPDYEQQDKKATLLQSCRWPIHAALTRTEAVRRVGGFDEKLSSCMDYDLWLRIATFFPIVRVPKVLAFYHHHGEGQITSNRLRIALNHWKVQSKFLTDHPDIASQLGWQRTRQLTLGELRRKAFEAFWNRDLDTAHPLFRKLLFSIYFSTKDLKYLLPAILPLSLYSRLVKQLDETP